MPKPRVARQTAYYLNGKIPALALIAKGVRLPSGTWLHAGDATALPEDLEAMLGDVFPGLKGVPIKSVTLMSDSDVEQFERSMPELD